MKCERWATKYKTVICYLISYYCHSKMYRTVIPPFIFELIVMRCTCVCWYVILKSFYVGNWRQIKIPKCKHHSVNLFFLISCHWDKRKNIWNLPKFSPGRNVLLWRKAWPKRPCPKRPSPNHPRPKRPWPKRPTFNNFLLDITSV